MRARLLVCLLSRHFRGGLSFAATERLFCYDK